MDINARTLDLAFDGFKAAYTDAHSEAPSHYDRIAMTVPSAHRSETYGWMGSFPQMREWVGPRVMNNLVSHRFSIVNRDFESTIRVPRNDIADDNMGIYRPMFAELGGNAKRHPDEMVFDLLARGYEENAYDGQAFFDTVHPVTTEEDGQTFVSNMQPGTDPAWFLLDTSCALRPIVWQEREPYNLERLDQASDPNVFFNNEYVYGVRARVNAGFGLWQRAYASKAPLTPDAYRDARAAMMRFRADGGRRLGVSPTVMVVPPELEEAGRGILTAMTVEQGGAKIWANSAELIVTPYLGA